MITELHAILFDSCKTIATVITVFNFKDVDLQSGQAISSSNQTLEISLVLYLCPLVVAIEQLLYLYSAPPSA